MVSGLGMAIGGHPEGVIHALDVGYFHSGFKEAIAILRFAIDVAGGPLVVAIRGNRRLQS
jgi:hypothetical protein